MAARNAPLASTPVGAFTTGANCAPVIFDPLSGVRGSPNDALKSNPANPHGAFIANTADLSTGAAITGIGFSALNEFDDAAIGRHFSDFCSGFNDATGAQVNYIPGFSSAFDNLSGTVLAIGGGYCGATVDGIAHPYPWATGLVGIGFMGNGTPRDVVASNSGNVPSFGITTIVDSAVANGATFSVFGAPFTNRTGKTLDIGDAAVIINEIAAISPYPSNPTPYPPL